MGRVGLGAVSLARLGVTGLGAVRVGCCEGWELSLKGLYRHGRGSGMAQSAYHVINGCSAPFDDHGQPRWCDADVVLFAGEDWVGGAGEGLALAGSKRG